MAYYTHSSGVPAANARGVSSNIRSEFDLIQTGFTSAYNDIQVLAAAIGAGTSSVESPIASATTTTIGSAGGNIVSITGTNTISSFGTTYNGAKYVRFTGSLTLLASASLVTPSGANIVTQAGDSCIVVPIGSPASGWRIASYERMSLPNLTDDAVRKATATLQTLVGSLAAVTFSASTSLVMGAASNAGLTVQTYTGGSKAAIYSNAVTPGASNYSLLTDSVSTTLNASTSVLLAIGGTTAATITNTGLNSTAIGATTPSTGAFTTLSASGTASTPVALTRTGATGVYQQFTDSSGSSVYIGGASGVFQVQTPSGGYSTKMAVSDTGLAVTGAVSATGNISTTGAIASGGIVSSTGFQSTGNGTNSSGSGVEILGGASGIVQGYNRTGGAYINMVVDGLSVALKSSGTTRAFVDSTGLAVTGQISASGRADFTLASTGRVGTFAGSGDRLRVFVNAASSGATIDVTDSGETTTARPLNIGGSNGTINLGGTTAVVSSTGLAVTGTVGATGNISTTAAIGAGGAPFSGVKLYSTGNTAAATTTYGVRDDQVIQSTSSTHRSVFAFPSTQATAFTLGAYEAFHANLGTIGSGSTITSAIGFLAASSLGGAGTAYGFQGAIAAGTNKYNLYMSGTADNYIAGNLGLGVTPSAWSNFGPAAQVGYGALKSSYFSPTNYQISLFNNAYEKQDTTYAYILSTNKASGYKQIEGEHQWLTAGTSGGVGTAVSFTQAMTLTAAKEWLLGTTSSASSVASGGVQALVDGFGTGQTTFDIGHITGTPTTTQYQRYFYNGTAIGSVTQSGTTAVAYNTTSDHRLKNNVRPADATRFMDIEFVDFEWTDGRHDCGVIADQLQSVYPSLVLGEKDATEVRTVEITPAVPAVLDEEGNEVTPEVPAVTEEQTFPVYQQVNYIGLIGRMGTVIQKQQRMLEALEARIAILEAA